MLENLASAIELVFTLQNLLFAVLGIIIGFFFGALPGIGGNVAIGLLIPFTYYLDPVVGIVCLLAIGKGTSFGGSVPAILLNMPGTSQASFTAIDGYQLTRKGQSKKALHTALYASVIGDLFSDIVLLLVAAPVAAVALKVGPPEYAAIVLFALLIIGALVGSSPIKGMVSTAFGLLVGTVGRDLFTAKERFTFGLVNLDDGFSIIPILLGLLVFSEAFVQLRKEFSGHAEVHLQGLSAFKGTEPLTLRELMGLMPTILRSGAIGTFVGATPGLGATVGAFLAYVTAKKLSKPGDRIGQGGLKGIAAAEAGNSAGTGANLIPLVTLGIPGNIEAALILGAFMIHGLTPGPFLLEQQGPLLYGIFISLIVANLLLMSMGFAFIHAARYALSIDKRVLFPIILLIATIGVYATTRQVFDVAVMYGFGVLGYAMRRLGFSPLPMLIAFLLGPLLEAGVRRAMIMSGGSPMIFIERPISLLFVVLAALTLALLLWRGVRARGQQAAAPDLTA
ncbi:MAG: tripartite tricarboxylate transporter permease [Kiloniellaceae bacterium]